MGGDLVAVGTTPPTLLSLPFPCISCLAVRCSVCGGAVLGMRRRSICVPVACAGLAVDRGGYGGC
jgi:hypothetical protein